MRLLLVLKRGLGCSLLIRFSILKGRNLLLCDLDLFRWSSRRWRWSNQAGRMYSWCSQLLHLTMFLGFLTLLLKMLSKVSLYSMPECLLKRFWLPTKQWNLFLIEPWWNLCSALKRCVTCCLGVNCCLRYPFLILWIAFLPIAILLYEVSLTLNAVKFSCSDNGALRSGDGWQFHGLRELPIRICK